MKGMIPMDKICKAYVSQVKAILPLWGKKEKALIRKLRSDLYDYCEYNNINTIEELYKRHGTPQEVVFEYISLMEPNVISKRINIAKYVKILVATLLVASCLSLTIWSLYIYNIYESEKSQEVIIADSSIQYYN